MEDKKAYLSFGRKQKERKTFIFFSTHAKPTQRRGGAEGIKMNELRYQALALAQSAEKHEYAFGLPADVVASTKIYDFVRRAYVKKGGAGEELKRVHAAYLANQKLRD